MALQAEVLHFVADQHARVGRTVRFMAGRASFQPHGGMLKGEGATQVAVAAETAGLVGGKGLCGSLENAAVGVVAIHAGHSAFGEAMLEWPLELRPSRRVATGALPVDGSRSPRDQPVGAIAMDAVAGCASHFVLGVTTLDPPDLSGLIQVTLQAVAIRLGSRQGGGIQNVLLVSGFGVLAAGTVARLAGSRFPSAAFVQIYLLMRILLEGVEDVFVAGLAGFRPDISRGGSSRCGGARSLGPRRPAEKERRHCSKKRRR